MTKPEKHYTATVFVLSDTKPTKTLLIHHRKYDKWMPPGGHQDPHENPIEAAARETFEETGVDVAATIGALERVDAGASFIPRPQYLLEEGPIPARDDQPEHYHLDQVYVVRVPEQVVSHNQAESHDIGWFTLEETEKLDTFDNVHFILRKEMTS